MKKPILSSDRDLLSLLSRSSISDKHKSLPYHYFYITNRDGSLRWVYPKSLYTPTFLNFFNQSNLRSKIIKFFISILFYKNLYLGRFTKYKHLVINLSPGSILFNLINRKSNLSYSIFLGTVGENRKIIIEVNDNISSLSFIKVGVTEASKNLVKNEHKTLEMFGKIETKSFNVPAIIDYSDGVLEVSNLKTVDSYQSAKLLPVHFRALKELYHIGRSYIHYENLPLKFFIQEEIEKLDNLVNLDGHYNSINLKTILPKLKIIDKLLKVDYLFSCSLSHGDFTPWNMYLRHDGIGIIDWEMSNNQIPILFDFFHFIFQSEVLLNKGSYHSVKQKICAGLEYDYARDIQSSFKIDINLHFLFYLLFNITRYLNLYVTQESPHDQIYWIVRVWEHALDDIIYTNGKPLKCF